MEAEAGFCSRGPGRPEARDWARRRGAGSRRVPGQPCGGLGFDVSLRHWDPFLLFRPQGVGRLQQPRESWVAPRPRPALEGPGPSWRRGRLRSRSS